MHLLWTGAHKFLIRGPRGFLFSGAHNLLLPLVSTHSSAGSLKLPQEAQLLFATASCLLIAPWVPPAHQVRQDRKPVP